MRLIGDKAASTASPQRGGTRHPVVCQNASNQRDGCPSIGAPPDLLVPHDQLPDPVRDVQVLKPIGLKQADHTHAFIVGRPVKNHWKGVFELSAGIASIGVRHPFGPLRVQGHRSPA